MIDQTHVDLLCSLLRWFTPDAVWGRSFINYDKAIKYDEIPYFRHVYVIKLPPQLAAARLARGGHSKPANQMSLI